jgi:hypothetical protein
VFGGAAALARRPAGPHRGRPLRPLWRLRLPRAVRDASLTSGWRTAPVRSFIPQRRSRVSRGSVRSDAGQAILLPAGGRRHRGGHGRANGSGATGWRIPTAAGCTQPWCPRRLCEPPRGRTGGRNRCGLRGRTRSSVASPSPFPRPQDGRPRAPPDMPLAPGTAGVSSHCQRGTAGMVPAVRRTASTSTPSGQCPLPDQAPSRAGDCPTRWACRTGDGRRRDGQINRNCRRPALRKRSAGPTSTSPATAPDGRPSGSGHHRTEPDVVEQLVRPVRETFPPSMAARSRKARIGCRVGMEGAWSLTRFPGHT